MRNILLTTAMCFSISISFSQEWKEKEPSTLFAVDENEDTTNVKVGIGTQTPAEKLHVIGNLKVEGKIIADSVNVKGQLTADSAVFNGVVKMTSGGESFLWFPNTISPAPSHDLLRVSTGYFTVMGWKGTGGALLGMGLNTETPTSMLDVNGTARIRNLTGAPHNFVVTSETNGTLHSIAFTGSTNDVLLGNGTFGSPTSITGPGAPWVLGGNPLATSLDKLGATTGGANLNIYAGGQQAMFINGGFNPLTLGFVGMGTQTPTEKLHILDGNVMVSNTGIFPGNLRGYYIQGFKALAMPGNTSNFFTNVAVGDSAGSSITSGTQNTMMGKGAGSNVTTQPNVTCFGYKAGNNTIGSENTFMGSFAGQDERQSSNTMIGAFAGRFYNFGNRNTMIGAFAGGALQTIGGDNTFVGALSGGGDGNQGERNTYLGTFAGLTTAQITPGNFSTGTDNIFIGYNAGSMTNISSTALNNGQRNIFIGLNAGQSTSPSTVTAADNILLGANTNFSVPALTNATAIGANTIVTASNKMILGDDSVNVGIGLSADPVPPANKLEINTADPSPTTTVGGNSGLKFRDLTSASTPVSTNPGTGVLGVDVNGNVIYVPGGTAIAGLCPTLPVLSADAGTNLNGKNFYFEGQGSVGIGITCAVPPGAKLLVYNNASPSFNMGILGAASAGTINTGVAGMASNIGLVNFGIRGFSRGATNNNFGGYFTADNPNAIPNFVNCGILVNASASGGASSNTNYGGIFSATGAFTNYGIVASVATISGGSPTDVAGQFNGDIEYTGNLVPISDSSLKENIGTINNALNIVSQLNPRKFNFKATPYLALPVGTQFGLIAQDVNTVLPELVSEIKIPDQIDSLGNIIFPSQTYKGLNYTGLIPISIAAIKQLDSTISAPPAAPILISPANGTVGSFGRAQLGWHSVSQGIIMYNAQIATDNTFTNIVFAQSTADTTAFFSLCDTIPATFFWRVNAKNNAGTGTFSQVFSFTDTLKCKTEPAPIGTIRAVAFASASDSRCKTNIAPLTDALTKVNALNPITYNWSPAHCTNMNVDGRNQIGLIAQDVEQIVPEVVYTDSSGMKYIDYGRLSALLIGAVKELQTSNLKLQTSFLPSTDMELASKNSILWQNFPNPFGDGTIIRYFVAEKSANANMLFYDEFGNEIKSVELPYKGIKAELNLSTQNLAAGIYSYSLVVDGKITDTKKMLKTQ